MILTTLFALLISGSTTEVEPRLIVGYRDGSPFVFEAQLIDVDTNGRTHYLQEEAAVAYRQMVIAAFAQDINLQVNYGFRSHDEQKRLRRSKSTRRLAAPAGKSPHEEGIAVDINYSKKRSPVYRWLIKHAAEFGFYNTISYEPWHWEFRGLQRDQDNQV